MSRVELIAGHISGRVLDIGHSVGTLHERVSEKRRVTGMDIVIKRPEKRVIKGDAQRMPVKGKSFDTILAGELIEHLEAPPAFLEECGRVLKKSGTLIITTPNRDSLLNRLFKSYYAPAHLSLFNEKELRTLLENKGFRIIKYALFPYTAESSEGSRHMWLFPLRKMLHYMLPRSLREEMVVVAALK